MTGNDELMREIEEAEGWLCEVCKDPAGPDVYGLKRRLAIELHEHWLRNRIQDRPPQGLRGRVMRCVHDLLGERQDCGEASQAPRGRVRAGAGIYPWLGAALAAACLVLAFGLRTRPSTEGEYSALDALERYERDDFGGSLSDLDENLDALERDIEALGAEWEADSAYDELFEDGDDLTIG